MPLTTTIFSSFMGKKTTTKHNRPSNSNTIDDEVSLVKAAAWAWYQRGSGSEGKPMGEFDIRRTQTVIYRPSRYKLETMKMEGQEEDADNKSKTSSSSVHCNNNTNGNNSLLDNYEIQSISRRLDQLIDSNTATELFDDDDDDRRQTVSGAGSMVKKGRKSGGFWFRHAVICGTREDVATRHCRLPKNGSPVVKSSSICRPRVTHA